MGALRGNQPTAKGEAMQAKHDSHMHAMASARKRKK